MAIISTGPNEFYLGISSLQKAVRRGHLAAALVGARMAFLHDPFRLAKRMFTILVEDCGGDADAMIKYDDAGWNYKEWDNVRAKVRIMVAAKQTIEPSFASRLITMDDERDKENTRLRYAKEVFPAWFMADSDELYAKSYEPYRRWIGTHIFFREGQDLDEKRFRQLVDFCERVDRKWDNERLCVALPFFALTEIYCRISEDQLVNEDPMPASEQIYRGICLSAMDKHTRVGGMANKVFMKNHKADLEAFGYSMDDLKSFGMLEWMNDGHLANRRIPNLWGGSAGYFGYAKFIEWYRNFEPLWYKEEAAAWFRPKRPELYDIRKWACDKTCDDTAKLFEMTYKQVVDQLGHD